ncbi:MAG TPA: hypothetical protein VF573_03490 [Paraburkholderia sp.]
MAPPDLQREIGAGGGFIGAQPLLAAMPGDARGARQPLRYM